MVTMGVAGVRRGICSVNDGWRFEERDQVEREMERGWRRRGSDSGFLRVLGFREMWGRRGSRGERE